MPYKFEKLEVWKLVMEYLRLIYGIADKLRLSKSTILKAGLFALALE